MIVVAALVCVESGSTMSMVRLTVLIALAAAFGCGAARSADPYGRAGLFVIEPGAAGGEQATSYNDTVAPAEGRRLELRVDSNKPAVFLVAAFDPKTSSLSQRLRPVLVERAAGFEEVAFPGSGKKDANQWSYERAGEGAELFVIVYRPTDASLPELRKLVRAIGDASEPKLRALLSRELRNRIRLLASRACPSGPAGAPPPRQPPGENRRQTALSPGDGRRHPAE